VGRFLISPTAAGRALPPAANFSSRRRHHNHFRKTDMATVITHHRQARYANESTHLRSRAVIATILGTMLAIYVAGIFWFGEGLAEDVRAGVREVQAGALIHDQEH
jgi:hypothetical protein